MAVLNGVDYNTEVQNIAKGDIEAFERLSSSFTPLLMGYFRKSVEHDVAEDLCQNVLMEVWQKADSFDPCKASAYTWMMRIAHNKKVDSFRRHGAREGKAAHSSLSGSTSDSDTSLAFEIACCHAISDHAGVMADGEELEIAREFLEDLRDDEKVIIALLLKDKTLREISEITGFKLGSVKSKINRMRERINGVYDNLFPDHLLDYDPAAKDAADNVTNVDAPAARVA